MHPANAVANLLQKTLAGQVAGSPDKELQITELQQAGHKLTLTVRDEEGVAHDVLVRVHKLVEDDTDNDPLSISRNLKESSECCGTQSADNTAAQPAEQPAS